MPEDGNINGAEARCQTVPRWLGLPVMAWLGVGMGLASGVVCFWAAGATLGLFFGGMAFAALLVPPLCLAEARLADRLLVAGAVNDGIATVWLVAVFFSPVTFLQWLGCYLLLICWCGALAGLACSLNRLLRSAIPAAAGAMAAAMLWLAAPVWLAHADVQWYLPAHPLLAINGVLKNLGIWSQHPIAYQYLLNLGQDVPYELPGIWPAAMIHLAIGVAGLVLGRR